jgi:hypothetical protein
MQRERLNIVKSRKMKNFINVEMVDAPDKRYRIFFVKNGTNILTFDST